MAEGTRIKKLMHELLAVRIYYYTINVMRKM